MPEAIVRPMREDDLACVLEWRNHPSVRDYMYTRHEITPEEHRRWFDRASRDPAKHPLVFEQGGVRAGFVNFTQPGAGPIADWGFYLAPDAASGSGRQLGTCALGFAFDTLSLHKVCGQALSYNDRSIRFHRRLGFTQEGLLRDQHFDGNDFHSIVCFGLLYQEWQTIVREDKT